MSIFSAKLILFFPFSFQITELFPIFAMLNKFVSEKNSPDEGHFLCPEDTTAVLFPLFLSFAHKFCLATGKGTAVSVLNLYTHSKI